MPQDLFVDPGAGPIDAHLTTEWSNSALCHNAPQYPPKERALARGMILRNQASYLSPDSFLALKSHLSSAYSSGFYLKASPPPEGSPAPAAPNPLTDPGAMDGMMSMFKKQAVSFLPQTILMYYIGYFYNGFVLTRLPFPLTLRFKAMLQRGIEAPDMDVTWVSSISWYFAALFGLNAVYTLLLGEENVKSTRHLPTSIKLRLKLLSSILSAADNAASMAAMNQMGGAMMGGGMPGQPAQDFVKLFKVEKENLEIVEYSWVCDGVEERLLKQFG
ncbi:ER membrane protein complex subunit 3, partial [Phenoliferia sp. Uapishka_3]